jgi:hypothetical protein
MSSDEEISIADLKTPPHSIADFCLIPIGTPTASVSQEIAAVQKLMKECGLKYHLHSAGTTLGKFGSTYRLPIAIMPCQKWTVTDIGYSI